MNLDRILLDVECQSDFFIPGGSCYTPGAGECARRIYRLFAWARMCQVPVLSTVLRVRAGGRGPLTDRPHCLEGTPGERKLPRTVLARHIDLGLRNTTDLPAHIFTQYQQVIFERRYTDIFQHARIERLVTELPPATFVLCGAGVAQGIVQAAVGLRTRGFPVILATDAVLDLNPAKNEMVWRRMEAKSVVFAPTEKIVTPAVRPRRIAFRTPQPTTRQAY